MVCGAIRRAPRNANEMEIELRRLLETGDYVVRSGEERERERERAQVLQDVVGVCQWVILVLVLVLVLVLLGAAPAPA